MNTTATIKIAPRTEDYFVTVTRDEVDRVRKAMTACGFTICLSSDISSSGVCTDDHVVDTIMENDIDSCTTEHGV